MLQVGQVLNDRYQLQQRLSHRGVRQTWLAIDLADSTSQPAAVVIKLLAFGELTQWQDYTLFQREAQILQNLQHPRIPAHRDQFTLAGTIRWFAIVQDYISGRSLQTLLDQGHRFTEAAVKQMAVDLLQILIYLHELNPPVLHRDIKPSNILIGEADQIYLVDFGAVQDRVAIERSTFTIVGTYGYTPIEQFRGRAVPASDLYALGATLIHIVTGIFPADLQSYSQNYSIINFQQYIPDSNSFMQWLEKLSHPDVTQRFSTARQALENLLQNSTTGIQPSITIPDQTRVKLHQSDEFLSIKVARRGIQLSDALLLGTGILTSSVSLFMLVSQVNPFLTLLCWLDSLPLLALGLLSAFGDAQLQFDRTSFLFRWTLLGIPYRKQQGKMIEIQPEQTAIRPDSQTGITIHTSERPYTIGHFAPELKPDECRWLTQTIHAWLEGSMDSDRSLT